MRHLFARTLLRYRERSRNWFERASQTLEWGELRASEAKREAFTEQDDLDLLLVDRAPLVARAEFSRLASYFPAGILLSPNVGAWRIAAVFIEGQELDCSAKTAPQLSLPAMRERDIKCVSAEQLQTRLPFQLPVIEGAVAFLLSLPSGGRLILVSRRPASWERDRMQALLEWLWRSAVALRERSDD